jgi:hypothetical protein
MKRTWLWVGVVVLALAFLYLPSLGVSGGQILAFLLLLFCPLMHFFGGHRHGSHGGVEPGEIESTERASEEIKALNREEA